MIDTLTFTHILFKRFYPRQRIIELACKKTYFIKKNHKSPLLGGFVKPVA